MCRCKMNHSFEIGTSENAVANFLARYNVFDAAHAQMLIQSILPQEKGATRRYHRSTILQRSF